MTPIRNACLIVLTALVATTSAIAGPVEVNQEIVEQGLPPCDSMPGFPCVIDVPGSYRLTSDLLSTDPNAHIVEITSPGVTLDLAGFSLRGPASCTWTGSAVSCASGTGSGDGVHASGAETIVRSGRVMGAGADGLDLADGAVIESVQISGVGGSGVAVGAGARISSSTVELSDGNGIEGELGSSVVRCTVRHAGGAGITGVSLVEQSRVISNEGAGIETAMSGVVRGNVVRDNGGDGVFAAVDSLVVDNTSAENDQYGLRFLTGGGAYGGNTIADNLFGAVTGPGTEIDTNVCDGTTTCP